MVHGDLPRQHPCGTTLGFTGPVPADLSAVDAIGMQLRDPIKSGLTRWRMAVLINKWTPPRNSAGIPYGSTRFSLSMEMSSLTRDETAEPVSRDQIIRRERGQGKINFPSSADHEQDWQPYPVDLYPEEIVHISFNSKMAIDETWKAEKKRGPMLYKPLFSSGP